MEPVGANRYERKSCSPKPHATYPSKRCAWSRSLASRYSIPFSGPFKPSASACRNTRHSRSYLIQASWVHQPAWLLGQRGLLYDLGLLPYYFGCSRWSDGATWTSQLQRTTQRLGKVILPTAFYCLAALAWSTAVSPIPDVSFHTHYWYTLGLEFIWVYAATVCMAPLFGLAKRRLSQKSYTTTVIAVGILAFVVNGYLAAMSTISAGEFSWLQKLMSAATYVVAFLIGGLLRDVTDVMDSDRAGAWACARS